MSLPPDPVICAVTLVHEVQHVKLGALLDFVTLTRPDDGRRYYAPWRDDPRPLHGLLQGTYAHLGVSGFWRRQREVSGGSKLADVEFARWRAATALAVQTLRSSGQLTSRGLEFVSGIGGTLDPWLEEPVPDEAMTLARQAAESHRAHSALVDRPVPAG
jgi:HEXXH motif-containing protein